MGEKLKGPLRDILDADLVFISQYATYKNRDKMFDDIWENVGKSKAAGLEIFEGAYGYMVRYKLTGERNYYMTEYIEFRDNKISKIEVYTGFETAQQHKT